MLLDQGIDQSVIDSQLTIVKGDAANVADVKNTLLDKDGQLVSCIVSGVGATPSMRFSVTSPVVMDNPDVCYNSAKALIEALNEIYSEQQQQQQQHHHPAPTKPFLTVISSTGISDGPEDVPFALRFLYHFMLAIPHKDKKAMERVIKSNMSEQQPESSPVFSGFISVRPSFFTGDHHINDGKGWQKLRVGTEDKPKVGYTIKRADVGEWIFAEVIKTGGTSWANQMVTLTS